MSVNRILIQRKQEIMRLCTVVGITVYFFAMCGCGSSGVAVSEKTHEGEPKKVTVKVEDDEMEKSYRLGKAAGRVFHTFTPDALRDQMLYFDPSLYSSLSPETVDQIFSEYKKKYALEIKTALNGVSSDEEMARYMEESGVAKELGMDRASVFAALKKIDPESRLIKPLGEFTKYYVNTPPSAPVVLPAEFEAAGAVYMAWPAYESWVWKVHANLVKEIKDATKAWIFVPNEYWQKGVELYLSKKGIDISNVKFLHIPTDDAWARNWGQLTVLTGKDKEPVFVQEHYVGYAAQPFAKKSAEAAADFGRYMDIPVYQLPLVCEQGGNIRSDGNGTIVCTTRIFEQNPDVTREKFEKILKDYYGLKRLIVIPKLKGEVNGHADHIKFANPHTVFVCSAPKDSLWHDALEETARILSNAKSVTGEKYQVVRVPYPTNYKHGIDGKGYNYNCGLMVNKKMLVPLYGAPEDGLALKIYRETLPGYKVVGMDYSAYLSGGINCQTLEVPLRLRSG